MKHVPCILVGNKLDLEKQRKITTSEMEQMAKQYKVECMEASAKTSVNVDQVLQN